MNFSSFFSYYYLKTKLSKDLGFEVRDIIIILYISLRLREDDMADPDVERLGHTLAFSSNCTEIRLVDG